MRWLAEDCNIVIKPADKGSCVVVWDKLDFLAKAENHLKDNNTYKNVKFEYDDLIKLVEKSNKMFKQLHSKRNISSSEFRYFSCNDKKSTNLDKTYLLSKTHKRLENVPGRLVISNCGTPIKNISEFFIIIWNLLCNLLNRT